MKVSTFKYGMHVTTLGCATLCALASTRTGWDAGSAAFAADVTLTYLAALSVWYLRSDRTTATAHAVANLLIPPSIAVATLMIPGHLAVTGILFTMCTVASWRTVRRHRRHLHVNGDAAYVPGIDDRGFGAYTALTPYTERTPDLPQQVTISREL